MVDKDYFTSNIDHALKLIDEYKEKLSTEKDENLKNDLIEMVKNYEAILHMCRRFSDEPVFCAISNLLFTELFAPTEMDKVAVAVAELVEQTLIKEIKIRAAEKN